MSTQTTGTTTGERITVTETGTKPMQLRGKARSSERLYGGDDGPNPYELLASALGTCTATTLRGYANRTKLPLGTIEVEVVHSRGSLAARDVYDRRIVISGTLSETQRAVLLQIADNCPVARSLAPGADINTKISPDLQDAPPTPAVSEYIRDMEQAWSVDGSTLN